MAGEWPTVAAINGTAQSVDFQIGCLTGRDCRQSRSAIEHVGGDDERHQQVRIQLVADLSIETP